MFLTDERTQKNPPKQNSSVSPSLEYLPGQGNLESSKSESTTQYKNFTDS